MCNSSCGYIYAEYRINKPPSIYPRSWRKPLSLLLVRFHSGRAHTRPSTLSLTAAAEETFFRWDTGAFQSALKQFPRDYKSSARLLESSEKMIRRRLSAAIQWALKCKNAALRTAHTSTQKSGSPSGFSQSPHPVICSLIGCCYNLIELAQWLQIFG